MLSASQKYPSDLTDQQWELIKHWLPRARPGGRPRTTDVRNVVNGTFYLIRTGCAWRYLPKEFPPWRTVYDYYTQWQKNGVIDLLHWMLVQKVRVHEKRESYPSRIIIDSQSSKAQFGDKRGYDGYKKVQGRKRNLIVDTLGLIHHLKVDSAKITDHQSATKMFTQDPQFIKNQFKYVEELHLDGGYRSEEFWLLVEKYGINIRYNRTKTIYTNKPKRILLQSNLKPVRWIVERTFAWLNHSRRLSRDYERKSANSEAMIQLAMVKIMLNRLTRPQREKRWINSA